MIRPRNTKDWFKVETSASNDLATCYFWIVQHCKGKFQVSQTTIKFEKEADAIWFSIGYR